MQKVYAKMVPRLLNDNKKKKRRVQRWQDIIERLKTEPDLLCWVITDEETWIFFSITRKSSIKVVSGSLWRCWGRRKLQNQNHTDHVLKREGQRSLRAFVTKLDDQSRSLLGDSAVYTSLSAQEETKVVRGQIVTASPRQCTCSQHPEHLAFSDRKEYHRTGTTSLFP